MAKKSNKKKQNLLNNCLKAPYRALIKVRDFYIKGMLGCVGKFGSSSAGAHNLPKRFSTSSPMTNGDDEYIRDMMRVAVTKSLKDKLELEILRAEVMGQKVIRGGDMAGPRSVVTFSRIDENEPCDFGDDVKVNIDLVPRRRSHAIPKSRDSFV